jgi:uncharacterized membrane protein YdjX (TVP38/TMEM64 family)
MPVKKIALFGFIATIIMLYIFGGGEKYLSIGLYKDLYEQSPVATAVVFFLVFFIGTSCSLPITGVLTLASGIIFGAVTGLVLSLVAATLGGTVALYSARLLIHDLVNRRFTGQIELLNKGIKKEGAFYLFSLRMIPVIPFWLLNLLAGLTSMRVVVFMLSTFLGMIPVMLILAFAGSQLGNIEDFSMAAIFTPGLILALALLASFPFIAKAIVALGRRLANKGPN